MTQADAPSPLAQELAARIAGAGGAITVADYMEAAAAYYYAHAVPFGAEGDFTTAPEISQMFGEMIGAWCADIWAQAGKPSAVNLVELGPGRGTLMADVLRTAKTWPDFASALRVHLVENSPRLRGIQKEILKDARATWHETLASVPQGFTLIVANEFFDALPIRQFVKKGGAWRERTVTHDGGAFHFGTAAEDAAASIPARFRAAQDGSIFEGSPASHAVMGAIASRIAANGGAALVIDYGHAQQGIGDTLQSLRRHAYADALENPGAQDITAHVDFTALAAAAQAAGAAVYGPAGQGAFLQSLGMTVRAEKLAEKATPEGKDKIATALYRLTSAKEMGTLFKAMAVVPRNASIRPAGFEGAAA
jgi:NADH dehydrogenase [ubiquinone] 1 alpha subcomplex assembly factor 7